MEYVYGIHTVESLLRRNPKSVQCLLLQVGRHDKRMAALLELAQNQGVAVLREPRADLDAMVSGRHQGGGGSHECRCGAGRFCRVQSVARV